MSGLPKFLGDEAQATLGAASAQDADATLRTDETLGTLGDLAPSALETPLPPGELAPAIDVSRLEV